MQQPTLLELEKSVKEELIKRGMMAENGGDSNGTSADNSSGIVLKLTDSEKNNEIIVNAIALSGVKQIKTFEIRELDPENGKYTVSFRIHH